MTAQNALLFQVIGDFGELGESGLEVFDDFDCESFLCLRVLVFLNARFFLFGVAFVGARRFLRDAR